jgi:hypothetical protein
MGQRPSVVGMTWSVTDNYIIRDVSYTPSNISDDVFKLILDGKEYQLPANNLLRSPSLRIVMSSANPSVMSGSSNLLYISSKILMPPL